MTNGSIRYQRHSLNDLNGIYKILSLVLHGNSNKVCKKYHQSIFILLLPQRFPNTVSTSIHAKYLNSSGIDLQTFTCQLIQFTRPVTRIKKNCRVKSSSVWRHPSALTGGFNSKQRHGKYLHSFIVPRILFSIPPLFFPVTSISPLPRSPGTCHLSSCLFWCQFAPFQPWIQLRSFHTVKERMQLSSP